MHAYRGQPCDYPVCDRVNNKTFCTAVGGHAFSTNGRDWNISPVIAYTPTQEWCACAHAPCTKNEWVDLSTALVCGTGRTAQ